jgi:acyl carrier protein
MGTLKLQQTAETLQQWLAARVATYVQKAPEDIKTDVPLAEYGLDSVYALTLSGDIEDHLGLTLEPTLMWDHPTINALAQALLQMTGTV